MQLMHVIYAITTLSLAFLAFPALADVGSPKSADVTEGKASIEYKGTRTGDGTVGYAAGYYRGLTDASADNAQRVMLKYETRF